MGFIHWLWGTLVSIRNSHSSQAFVVTISMCKVADILHKIYSIFFCHLSYTATVSLQAQTVIWKTFFSSFSNNIAQLISSNCLPSAIWRRTITKLSPQWHANSKHIVKLGKKSFITGHVKNALHTSGGCSAVFTSLPFIFFSFQAWTWKPLRQTAFSRRFNHSTVVTEWSCWSLN